MSTSKEAHDVYVEMFNNKADEFFKTLVTSFPEIKPFGFVKTGLTMLRNVNPKRPIEIFNKYVYAHYKDVIQRRDEEFFLNNTYDLSKSTAVEYWLEFIENIRHIWKTLDNDEKDVIWKYFHVLIILNEKAYHGKST